MKEIIDEQGHSVKMTDRAGAHFRDSDGKEYFIDTEMLTGNGVALYTKRISYLDKLTKEPISESKKNEIYSISIKLFQSIGLRVEVY